MKKLLALAMALFAFSALGQVIPVKNLDPRIASITKQEVIWIYTMKTRFWEDGTRITVHYRDASSAEHQGFVKGVLVLSPSQFDEKLSLYINTGNAGFFRKADDDVDMLTKVSTTDGSVGYVNRDFFIIAKDNHVRKIPITE